MHNTEALSLLNDCDIEFQKLENKISSMNSTDESISFLTNYSIIKCCGTFEQCIKIITYDKLTVTASDQIKKHLDKIIIKSSMNPSLENIKDMLGKFDNDWKNNLKNKINEKPNNLQLISELKSLNKLRNDFAHGYMIQTSFSNIKDYYNSGKVIINILDEVLI